MQRLRQRDGAVRLLPVLQNRDQAAADRETGAVQRMNEFGARALLAALPALLDI